MDILADMKAARVAVFDTWLYSVDQDLLGTGSFLADFGIKNIKDSHYALCLATFQCSGDCHNVR
jgi:hypothetical protein